MIDVDYSNNYDILYCPELGSMCDTNRDCTDCLYRNNYLDAKNMYKPKDRHCIFV